MKLTQARLKDLLYYDPELGWFMWTAGATEARHKAEKTLFTRMGERA